MAQGVRVFKSVHYFLMEYIADSELDHDAEMEEVLWVPLAEAIKMVAYPQIKDLLKRCEDILKDDAP